MSKNSCVPFFVIFMRPLFMMASPFYDDPSMEAYSHARAAASIVAPLRLSIGDAYIEFELIFMEATVTGNGRQVLESVVSNTASETATIITGRPIVGEVVGYFAPMLLPPEKAE